MPKASKPAGMAEFSFLPPLVPQPLDSQALDPQALGSQPSAVGAEGHRARLRQRLLTSGADALADHEMLEMMLFIALPRRDTKPIAKELLARLGTFGRVISAPEHELRAVDGVGEAGAAAIKLVQAAALRMMRQDVIGKPVLAVWDDLIKYLLAAMQHEPVEQFRVLFMDGRNRLLADEIQTRGTINHAPAYPREVVRRCLELRATAVILAHNHPSGDPTASREDVALTRDIVRVAEGMGIGIHDHIIIGRGKWLSFRSERLL